jgi:hypothetical protein
MSLLIYSGTQETTMSDKEPIQCPDDHVTRFLLGFINKYILIQFVGPI